MQKVNTAPDVHNVHEQSHTYTVPYINTSVLVCMYVCMEVTQTAAPTTRIQLLYTLPMHIPTVHVRTCIHTAHHTFVGFK